MHVIPIIDFEKLARAQEYYTSRGYQEISVPWILSHEPYEATRPPNRREFFSLDGYLNASGEQSFLELLLSGYPLSKHCCITACFRDEPETDAYHHRYFMKLELINTVVSSENLQAMITDAVEFFKNYLEIAVVPTNNTGDAFDIIAKQSGIELGSYGIRTYKNITWIYGTGIALPRLDTVIINQTKN